MDSRCLTLGSKIAPSVRSDLEEISGKCFGTLKPSAFLGTSGKFTSRNSLKKVQSKRQITVKNVASEQKQVTVNGGGRSISLIHCLK